MLIVVTGRGDVMLSEIKQNLTTFAVLVVTLGAYISVGLGVVYIVRHICICE